MSTKKKQARIYLANLDVEVPVVKIDRATSQATVLVADIPAKLARGAGLVGKYAKYWFGENGGGNRLIEADAETEEQKKAREFVEAAAQGIIDISTAIHKLLDGKLKKSAIILLIQEAAGGKQHVSREQVEKILDSISKLDKTFLK